MPAGRRLQKVPLERNADKRGHWQGQRNADIMFIGEGPGSAGRFDGDSL